MGIVPSDTDLSPMNPLADATSVDGKPWAELDTVRPWESLDDDESGSSRGWVRFMPGWSPIPTTNLAV